MFLLFLDFFSPKIETSQISIIAGGPLQQKS